MAKLKQHHCDVLIAGGGAPGLVLACFLGRVGLSVAVAEPMPLAPLKKTPPDGRTSALMHGSVEILKRTGAWGRCESYGAALEHLSIIDDSPNTRQELRADFHAAEINLDYFGINMPNAVLRAALGETVAGIKTIKVFPCALESYICRDHGLEAHLQGGETIAASLIVGADGRESRVREIAGIACRKKSYRQNAITFLIDHTKPHNNISTEFHRPGGPFTLVPMPGQSSSVVWVDFDSETDKIMRLRKAEFERLVQSRSHGVLGKISLASSPTCWPLIRMTVQRLTAPRMALAAEAAHVIHPLGAQGLNLSLRDIDVLSQIVIEAAQTGLDIGSKAVLDRYESQRRIDVLIRSTLTDTLTDLVSHPHPVIHGLRRIGLKTVSGFSPLREIAMRHGMAA